MESSATLCLLPTLAKQPMVVYNKNVRKSVGFRTEYLWKKYMKKLVRNDKETTGMSRNRVEIA